MTTVWRNYWIKKKRVEKRKPNIIESHTDILYD